MDTESGTERGATVDGHLKWDRRGCYCRWTLEVGQKEVLLQMDTESGTEGSATAGHGKWDRRGCYADGH